MLIRSVMKCVSILAVAMMALAGFSACSQSSTGSGSSPSNQAPIKIGASISLTGDFSDDGKALQKGYEVWRDEVNKSGGLLGRQVVLDILNDNSSADQVTVNYQKLITVDKVDLVIGPLASPNTIPAMRVAKRYGYAFVEAVGSADSVFNAAKAENIDDLFAVSLPVHNYFASFDNFILSIPQSIRPKTVAYVSADDPFALQPTETAKVAFGQGGLQTVVDTTYPAEATDFTTYAQKIVNSKADVVVIGSLAVPDSTGFINYFKKQKYDPKAIIFATGPDQADAFTKPIGGAQFAEGVFVPNGSWTPDSNTLGNKQFVSDYLAKYGGTAVDISATTAEGFSAGQVLAQAINHIHSIDNASLIKELRGGTYDGVQGPVKFGADGENILALPYLFQWQKGTAIVVYPSTAAQQNPEYPKPAVW